ncbi:hypothetical protein Landi51_03468 [Colletotrichum acutatum]
MSHNLTSNSTAKNTLSSFGYMERYGHLAPPRDKPTHEFDNLEQSLSVRINDKYINCFRLVAAGKNTAGTGCGVRIHAFTNDSECKDIAMKGKGEDVHVTVAPKDKLADEVAGEIMAVSLGNQGYSQTPSFSRKSARSPVEDISSVPLSDVFLRNWAPMMNLDIVPDAYPITFLAITHVRFAVLDIIHPIQFVRRPLPANPVSEPFKRPLEIDRVIGGGGPLAVTRLTDGERVYLAGPLYFGGRCRIGEDGCLADVVRYTGHGAKDPEEKRSGDGNEDNAGESQLMPQRKGWLDEGIPIPAADQEDAC